MNHFMMQKLLRETAGEPERVLDVRVATDGSVRPGDQAPDAMERKKVQDFRGLVQAVVAGEADLAALQEQIAGLLGPLQQAVQQCEKLGQQDPSGKAFFDSNIECYRKSIDGLQHMAVAVERDDAESLWQGLSAFEAGIQEADALITAD
ncbi:MAG TPA: hypothetical protein VGO93_25535 [Candidatus Xenobia bacterium]|jgi:hypothetical protein